MLVGERLPGFERGDEPVVDIDIEVETLGAEASVAEEVAEVLDLGKIDGLGAASRAGRS